MFGKVLHHQQKVLSILERCLVSLKRCLVSTEVLVPELSLASRRLLTQ